MAYRDAKLDESLLGIVKEVRERIRALYPQKALVLRRTHRVVPIAQYYLVRQEDKVQLAVLVHLSDSIAYAFQMQRKLEN